MPGTFDTSIRSYRFYARNSPQITANFADCKLEFIDRGDGRTNFVSQGVIIANDHGANEIQFSFDGITVEGDLLPGESLNFFALRRKVVYLRGSAAHEPFRVWAW